MAPFGGDVMGVGGGSGARPSRRSGPSGPSPDGTPSHLSALVRDRKTSGEAGRLRRLEYNFEKFVLKGMSCVSNNVVVRNTAGASLFFSGLPPRPLPCPHLFSLGADGAGQGRGWGAQPQVSLGGQGRVWGNYLPSEFLPVSFHRRPLQPATSYP